MKSLLLAILGLILLISAFLIEHPIAFLFAIIGGLLFGYFGSDYIHQIDKE